MHLFRKAILMILAIAMATLSGCGGDTETAGSVPTREKHIDPVEAATGVTRSAKKKSASLSLGEQTFELDVVICIGTSTASVVASDSQKRTNYPVLTVKTYDPAMTGGQSINTASALFELDGYGEHWKLHEGAVNRDGKLFTASGTLEGSLLTPKSDGTRESMPLAGANILTFEIRVEC